MSTPNDDLDFGQTIRGFAEGQKVFGRYVLRQVLGRGGMGIVWLAWDEKLEEDIALKFMPEMVRLDDVGIQDLKRETRKSLKLTHANIVRIRDFVEDTNSAGIAMEYIDGPTLSSFRLQQPGGVFAPEQLTEWVCQLLRALEYAHDHEGIVHRDLKPANLMINSKGQLKIADFGISSSVTDSVSRMSMRAGTSGSPPYMSPQQVMGDPPQATDDIYSVGATIYELITGKPPFFRGNIYAQIKESVPPPMTQRLGELQEGTVEAVPEFWEVLVARCLAKDPGERPQSAREMLDWLEGRKEMPGLGGAVGGPTEPPKEPPPIITDPPPEKKKTLGKASAIALVVAGMVALPVLAASWWYGYEKPRLAVVESEQRMLEAERQAQEAKREATERQARLEQEAKEAEVARVAEADRKAKEAQAEEAELKQRIDLQAKESLARRSHERNARSLELAASVNLDHITPLSFAGKVAIVDVGDVFSDLDVTKTTEATINEARKLAKTELDDRMDSYKKLTNDVTELQKKSEDSSLSGSLRGKFRQDLTAKVADARQLEREIQEFRTTRQRQLQEQSLRMRRTIIEDIDEAIQAAAKASGADIVLDSAGNSLRSTPVVLYVAPSVIKNSSWSDLVKSRLNTKQTGAFSSTPPVSEALRFAVVDLSRLTESIQLEKLSSNQDPKQATGEEAGDVAETRKVLLENLNNDLGPILKLLCERAGIDVVVDSGGLAASQVPVVLASPGLPDLTNALLKVW